MNILITGGTGSLGNALVSEFINSPTMERICIYSRDEHKQETMRAKFENNSKLRFFIGDVRDKDRLTLACKNIQIIIHAAALKIVPVGEYNPVEVIKTNVWGAQNVIDAAIDNCSSIWPKVLLISSDKAVHPINLYGASKLCAEKLFINANNIMGNTGPKFSVARYGNVANSNGSVIPLFQSQIARGENLTITHDQMTRFWITLEEAVNLVKYSLNNMHGGEIFVPEMPSFNIKELALTMMGGYELENQWCRVIGIRPGEKLYEEIITKEEMEKTTLMHQDNVYIINKPNKAVDPIMPMTKEITSNSENVHRLTSSELETKLGALKHATFKCF